jgi:8-oxo-dGTP diphosphatase
MRIRARRPGGRPRRIRTAPPGRRPPSPALTVDAVWFSGPNVLLVRRKSPPFRGKWALPGGFVESYESTERAVLRELEEETGLRARIVGLVGVYSEPGRDPRGPTASVVYQVTGRARRPSAASDAQMAAWVAADQLPPLAFDHAEILEDALARRARPPTADRPLAVRPTLRARSARRTRRSSA